jgi:hypothetical protein
MPQFGKLKKKLGNQLRSNGTAGEDTQNILCPYLSVAVQTGVRTWRAESCKDGY